MALAPGSPEVERIRSQALQGDEDSLRRYVYWTWWRGMLREQGFSIKERRTLFRSIVKTYGLKVTLNG